MREGRRISADEPAVRHVLAKLADIWVRMMGIAPEEVNYTVDDQLWVWLMHLGEPYYEGICKEELIQAVEIELGVCASCEEWDELFAAAAPPANDSTTADDRPHSVAENGECRRRASTGVTALHERLPSLTVAEFVEWIIRHAGTVHFEPARIAGTVCASAGAFLGIQQLAENGYFTVERFAPSTPILDRLRGERLLHFWNRVALHAGVVLPELAWPFAWLASLSHHVALKSWLSALLAMVGGNALGLVISVIAALTSHVAGFMIKYIGNPLPENVQTFRDLAQWIAAARHAPPVTCTEG